MQTCVVCLVLLLVTSALAGPLPFRVRFPDERSDDERTGRILLPPFEQPTREDLIRIRANPIALVIPREPLPLAEPDQSLNAWQFYFPPGPPPPPPTQEQSVSGEDLLDTAGSAALTSTVSSTSRPVTEEPEVTTVQSEDSITTTVAPVTEASRPKKVSSLPTSPPDFKPKFEDGGWDPIAVVVPNQHSI